ncbi:hypothetical protein [Desertihabitans aurantiacus]|uniref:hypothetical protein n=1 Tax=Desertihabitans aurantiacus TaxID=2282477 RepID=UPI0013005214|nr:hypothetical protein [Desertihabitans aurantiacus]
MGEEEDDLSTQWTAAARTRYVAAAETLIASLRSHVELTRERSGRQRELPDYFASVNRLETAAAAFQEAEFDWCGSFPLPLYTPGEGDPGEEDVDDRDADPTGQVLTVVSRSDYRLVDADAVLEAGRAGYRRSWSEDTDEDARLFVADVAVAVLEIIHADGSDALDRCPGLDPEASTETVILHDGDAWPGDDDADPFAIVRR